MQVTQKIRIFPSIEQEEVLWVLSEKCRLIYNFGLEERIRSWKNGESVSYIDQQNKLPSIKAKFPEYKWVYSKVLQMVLKTLDANYKSFFALWKNGDEDANPPKFRGKKYFVTMNYNQSGFKISKNKVKLSQYYSDSPLEFVIPEKYEFGKVFQVTIYKDMDKWFLSVIHEKIEKEYEDNGLYQAIDLGLKNIISAVNSNGKFFQVKNKRADKYWNSKTKEVQSKRDHCRKKSRKWHRYNNKLNKMKTKCSNQIKDFQHKLSTKMVNNTKANTIIVGDLNIKKMSKKVEGSNKSKKGLNRSLQNTGFISRFVRYLTYKATLLGKRVIAINERNTTKTCCFCGKKHLMTLSDRIMNCDCGNVMDRDRNSAVNIMKRYLSQNALVNRLSSFEDIMRQTANCKMKVSPVVGLDGLAGSPLL